MAQESFGNDPADVLELQGFLRRIARENDQIPLIALDGIFGPETTAAVKAFQKAYGLPVTGIVTLEVWNALLDEYERILRESNFPYPISPFPSATYVVKLGDKGDLVTIIQIMLDTIQEGFTNLHPGGSDGVYDRATQQAVEAFQKVAGLPVSGQVDRTTWDVMALNYNFRIHR